MTSSRARARALPNSSKASASLLPPPPLPPTHLPKSPRLFPSPASFAPPATKTEILRKKSRLSLLLLLCSLKGTIEEIELAFLVASRISLAAGGGRRRVIGRGGERGAKREKGMRRDILRKGVGNLGIGMEIERGGGGGVGAGVIRRPGFLVAGIGIEIGKGMAKGTRIGVQRRSRAIGS